MTVLKVAGSLSDTSPLMAAIALAMEQPGNVVVCDLSELEVPLTPGLLMAFPAAQEQCDPWPTCSLLLAGASDELTGALRALRIPRYVPTLPTLEEGVAQATEELAATRFRVGMQPSLDSPRTARLLLGTHWPAGRSGQDEALLVLHELAANAVRHVGADYGASWMISPQRVVIGVSDPARQEPVVRQWGTSTAPWGRGMQIVDALSRCWGVRLRYGGGKTVWAEVI